MELFFNDISIKVPLPDKYAAHAIMELFSQALSEAKKKGVSHVRSSRWENQIVLSENYTLYDWLKVDTEVPKNLRDFLYGMFKCPIIDEKDKDLEEEYLKSNFYFEDKVNNIERQECEGLASAYLYDSIAISLQTNHAWEKNVLSVTVKKDERERDEEVLHVFSKNCLITAQISQYIEENEVIKLVGTELSPEEKAIHLADHHGKAELDRLCNKLKRSNYVIEMRSMEWCRGKCNEFIKKIHGNGVIEIVLYETDSKYALWVQTTGRNLRETAAIAKNLESLYG